MQALQLSNGRLNYRTDFPIPIPGPGEALIKITLAGICSTDLATLNGYKNFQGIPVHEFVGVVHAVTDEAHSLWLNKRVVGEINIGCQTCSICLTTGSAHCASRKVLGILDKEGAFAEYITLPVRNLYPVPDSICDHSAVFTEPLAAACRIKEQIPIKPGSKTAVVGSGRLGLLIGQVCKLAGSDVLMLGRHRASLKLAAQWGLQTALAKEYPANSFDIVIDASGNNEGLAQAIRLTKPLGTLFIKSTLPDQTTVNLNKIVIDEIKVIGSRCGPFAAAIQLLAENKVSVQETISDEFAFKEMTAAFHLAGQPGIRKILLHP